MKYRYTGNTEVFLPSHHRIVQPGEVVESDEEIRNQSFVLVTTQKPERPAKEE